MYALISPNEKQGQYQRIAELAAEPFDVAEPLHWVAAPVGTTLDGHAYDPATQTVVVSATMARSGEAGGAAGAAVVGDANITWAATGTRLGSIT